MGRELSGRYYRPFWLKRWVPIATTHLDGSDHSLCMSTAIENPSCTGRAAGTKARFRYALSVPGRATDTSPRVRRGRVHRRSRCGIRHRLRVRTRSYPEPRGCRWGCRCLSWQRTLLVLTPKQLDAGLGAPLSRPPNLRLCRPCGSYSTGCQSARCSSVKDVLKS